MRILPSTLIPKADDGVKPVECGLARSCLGSMVDDTDVNEGTVEVEAHGTWSGGSASLNSVESWVVEVVENVAKIDCGEWSWDEDATVAVLHFFFAGLETVLRVSRLEKYSSLSPSSSSELTDESDPDSPSLSWCSFLCSFSITHRYCPEPGLSSVEEAHEDKDGSTLQ